MSLTTAPPETGSVMPLIETATVTAVPSGGANPVAGDTNNTNLPASATVMIVIGVVLGIVGVASVITLIWWMRRRNMQRLRMMRQLPPPSGASRPMPPPKSGSSKALPQLNVSSANAYHPGAPRAARSNTNDSLNKDKDLPVKPVESVWTSPTDRYNKSPALASVNEVKTSPKIKQDEEMAMQRMRSDSVGSYQQPTAPANFI